MKTSAARVLRPAIIQSPWSLPWPGLRGKVVRDSWLFTHQFTHVFFDDAIGVGDALMLSQVFQPRIDEEGLEHSFRVRSILVHAPRVGAVALALAAEAPNSGKKRFAHFSCDPVFERNQHGTRVVFHGYGEHRRRPVHRGREIRFWAGL